ncbi:MAG TPA: hypothetical protein VGE52_15680, partial [Pirellulales bacterium]
IESRLLAGDQKLFNDFYTAYRRSVRARAPELLAMVKKARDEERVKFTETVHLVEPNVKRSFGALRDVQLIRWIGFLRYGAADPWQLREQGALTRPDADALCSAYEYLLRLRNDMHFHAGRARDSLDRGEQIRLTEARGVAPAAGLAAVEVFMQDYFRKTQAVGGLAERFLEGAQPKKWLQRATAFLFSHTVDRDFSVGPYDVRIRRSALGRASRSLEDVLYLADASNVFDQPIEHETSEAIRRTVAAMPADMTPEARRLFKSLLTYPGRLAEVLRRLHHLHVLEKVLPEFARVRGLLELHADRKFTIDEHSILAVERATQLPGEDGPLGELYQRLPRKWMLHLALLLHDLGHGLPEDPIAAGVRIAQQTAARLGLSKDDAATLAFLVERQARMAELAFRRDTTDPEVIVNFAVEVGSPEVLDLLCLLTAADLQAMGPGAWNTWKRDVLTDLYIRTMSHLSGDSSALEGREHRAVKRAEVCETFGANCDNWVRRQVDELPSVYVNSTAPSQIAAELNWLRKTKLGDVQAHGEYLPETGTVRYKISAHESVAPGIFHKLAGALASKALEILAAEIHTLADGLVLDRFEVRDGDFSGAPPAERIAAVCEALREALLKPGPPPLERGQRYGRGPAKQVGPPKPTSVHIDNATSTLATIVDVFTGDRPGLLYAIGRTLFDLHLSISLAKISTHRGQVVDVFYVTDEAGKKIDDPERLQRIHDHLVERIEAFAQQPLKTWEAAARPDLPLESSLTESSVGAAGN